MIRRTGDRAIIAGLKLILTRLRKSNKKIISTLSCTFDINFLGYLMFMSESGLKKRDNSTPA